MPRWAMLFLFATATTGAAFDSDKALASDKAVTPQVRHHARAKLPAGLPRAHYNYRTTVVYGAPAAPPPVVVYRDPDVLFTPEIPYIPPLVRAPLLPGSDTIPGYYGLPRSFDYQGPYYGGPYVSYWDRLPYACGVYGYC
jgi:hypothetical protein